MMEWQGDYSRLSATDLVGFLNCGHLTELERAAARGLVKRPFFHDPHVEALRERGLRHEADFVAHLESIGLEVVRIGGVGVTDAALAETSAAMKAGPDVIVQGALRSGPWVGRADVLRRVETPSSLGAWSYEPLDTKLSKETKAGAVLQLCLYAELLADAQGLAPAAAHVVSPWRDYVPETFRLADYAAFFRRVTRDFESALAREADETYPEPTEHCGVCRWSQGCEARRRADDHLSLIAGVSKAQIRELASHAISTGAALADVPRPLPWRPDRGAPESYERAAEQARLQVQGRAAGEILYELLPMSEEFGLAQLPAPNAGDIFLDFEGDAFVGEGGLEYLFGYAWCEENGEWRYVADWAMSRGDERAAFERFIDAAIARLDRWPGLHIYHYAPYEPAALKRLMGRYASREDEVDRLLRGKVFVDLFAIVRRSIRASVESYSIKRLEPLYHFERGAALVDANRALGRLQACLELGDIGAIADADRALVEAYNHDDCVSAQQLRDWLETRRADLVSQGVEVPRPQPPEPDPPESVAAWVAKIEPVIASLMTGMPEDPAARSPEQQATWLLANLLDWHRRERKSDAWEYFRLKELPAEELTAERAGLAGLVFIGEVEGKGKLPTHRYRFPPQESDLRGDDALSANGGDDVGTVAAISIEAGWIDIKKRGDSIDRHPPAVFSHKNFQINEQQEALLRIAQHVVDHGLAGEGAFPAARAMLLRALPAGGAPVQHDTETPLDAALRLADALPAGVLPIQGPPGTGKTFTGAQMILRLVRRGKKVGVLANSHKVIRNLLDEVVRLAEEAGDALVCLHKADEPETDKPRLRFAKNNPQAFAGLKNGCHVLGGTVWLWSRQDAADCVDVLVVDEAAQMALANVLAASHCARSIILLGDPQQLDQPVKGSHPDGTAISALHYMLEGRETIPPERGLFLAETWRLHPRICDFTSELFYEGRLTSRPGREGQALLDAGALSGAGLRYLPIPHAGNQNSSVEEAEAVAAMVQQLLAGAPGWTDHEGEHHGLTLADMLFVAPYNAQVFELKRRLPEGAQVGTVDKFQGQQAPLVFYSLTTSSHADAPRGMEFLYSLNRFNVATSRARCVSVLVASPSVLAADCRTPRQMQLVNAYCRFLEMADQI